MLLCVLNMPAPIASLVVSATLQLETVQTRVVDWSVAVCS